MKLLQVLPLAIVMVAGPQLLSSIFFATTEKWRTNSVAYIAGAAISIPLVVTIAFLLGGVGSSEGEPNDAVYWVILALLGVAILRTYLKREESEPPKWMAKLQTATPRFAFILGFLLLSVFPTDLLTAVSVGSFLAAGDEPLTHCIPYVLLTLLLLALPLLAVVVMGERAERSLPKIRDWMNTNSWIVNEAVLVFFVLMVASNLA